MKTKHSLVRSRILLIGLLLAVNPLIEQGTTIFAQGIYSRNVEASENNGEDSDSDNNRGSLFRAGGTENTDDGGQSTRVSPVKDGWGVLIIAGIGYGFFLARRKKD
jgi:hypothetical protein